MCMCKNAATSVTVMTVVSCNVGPELSDAFSIVFTIADGPHCFKASTYARNVLNGSCPPI